MTTRRVAGFASGVVLLVVAWAMSAYVDGSSAWARVVLGLGVVALLVVVLSSSPADRLVWRPLARTLQGKLDPADRGPGPQSSSTLQVANRLLAELEDSSARLQRWRRGSAPWWADSYQLPTSEWEVLRGDAAGDSALGEAWSSIAAAYREVDRINRLSAELATRQRVNEGEFFTLSGEDFDPPEPPEASTGVDDLDEALEAVQRAEAGLRNALSHGRSWTGQRPR